MCEKILKFMKEKPAVTFLVIVISILIVYYIYQTYYTTEHLNASGIFAGGISGSLLISVLSLIICFIQIIILYYIIKYANKNAIIETSQKSQKSQNKS
jgi:uncharacterized membrane protein